MATCLGLVSLYLVAFCSNKLVSFWAECVLVFVVFVGCGVCFWLLAAFGSGDP